MSVLFVLLFVFDVVVVVIVLVSIVRAPGNCLDPRAGVVVVVAVAMWDVAACEGAHTPLL